MGANVFGQLPRYLTIPLNFSAFTPADSITYYFGALYTAAPGTSASTIRSFQAPFDLTLVSAFLHITQTVGSSENTSIYCRINNTTDVEITTSFAGNLPTYSILVSDLNININQGQTINGKLVTPTWVTNPNNIVGTLLLTFALR